MSRYEKKITVARTAYRSERSNTSYLIGVHASDVLIRPSTSTTKRTVRFVTPVVRTKSDYDDGHTHTHTRLYDYLFCENVRDEHSTVVRRRFGFTTTPRMTTAR